MNYSSLHRSGRLSLPHCWLAELFFEILRFINRKTTNSSLHPWVIFKSANFQGGQHGKKCGWRGGHVQQDAEKGKDTRWGRDSQLGNRKCWVCSSTISGICHQYEFPFGSEVRCLFLQLCFAIFYLLFCWRAWSFLPLRPIFCISDFPLISELVADPVLVWIEKLSCFRCKILFELLSVLWCFGVFLIELTTLTTVSVAVTLGLV